MWFGDSMNKSFWVLGPSQAKSALTALENALGAAVMDVIGGEHCDAGMTMLGVVPGEEGPAEGGRGGDVCEAPGEAGMIFQGLELRLGEGVVVADLGAAQRASDPEVGEQLRGALAGHGRAAVGVQGEHLGRDGLFVTGLFDEPCSQSGAFPFGDHPPHDVSAEDVEQDVEVEVRPTLRSQHAGDIPRPGLVRRGGDELGLGVVRMGELIAPFSHRLLRGQDAIHRALRAQVLPFIEQGRDDLRRRTVDEARRHERVQDLLAFGLAKRPGGRGTGLLAPGSGPLTTIEGGP